MSEVESDDSTYYSVAGTIVNDNVDNFSVYMSTENINIADNVDNNGGITNMDDLLADLLNHGEEPVTMYGTKNFSDLGM